MTWIKTIPISESDEKLRRAMEAQRELYPSEYAVPIHPTPDGQSSDIVASQPDSRRALSCICYVWIFDVAGLAIDQTAARDDYDRRLSRQSLSLLNRISRRVSASRYPGCGTGKGAAG